MAAGQVRRCKSRNIKANHSVITVAIRNKAKEEVIRKELKKMTRKLDHLLQEGFSADYTIIS